MKNGNLGFIRMAAMDGVHDPQEISTNNINGERPMNRVHDPQEISTNNINGERPMNRRIARRIKVAFEIAKRDPVRTAEFITDVLIIIGLLALVYIAWSSCKAGIA